MQRAEVPPSKFLRIMRFAFQVRLIERGRVFSDQLGVATRAADVGAEPGENGPLENPRFGIGITHEGFQFAVGSLPLIDHAHERDDFFRSTFAAF